MSLIETNTVSNRAHKNDLTRINMKCYLCSLKKNTVDTLFVLLLYTKYCSGKVINTKNELNEF